MKSLIILGLVVTLSSVFCKEHQIHNRQNVPQRKYKDTKSKRGIGDYPLNLSFGAPSIGSFQPAGHVSGPFSAGLPNYGSYGGYGSGNLLSSPVGLQASPSFSVIGSHGLSGLNYGGLSQPVSLAHQNTEYAASAPTINLASLLGGQSVQASYASPSIGLFNPEKTGPVTFTTQAVEQPRQQYTPVYASAHSIGSSRIATPLILGSASSGGYQLGTSLQRHSLAPTSLRSLSSIGSLSSNGVGYAIPASLSSSPLSRDSSSHTVSGGYVIGANQLQSGSSPTYSLSGSSSSPSTSEYMITLPSSSSTSSSSGYQLSAGSSPSYQLSSSSPSNYQLSSSSPSNYQLSSSSSPNYQLSAASSPSYQSSAASPSSYQLSAAASSYSASPSNSYATNYAKYNPSSSDSSTYPGAPLKLSFGNYGSSSGSSSTNGNYASAPSYSNSASTSFSAPSDSSGHARHPITSYGTPATSSSYSIPSTSYGVPSSSQYVSNLSYNSQNSDGHSSSGSYTPSSISSYSRPGSSYGSSSSSPSYDSIKNLDSSMKMPSVSFSDPSVNYGSGSTSSSSDSYSSYKSPPPSISSSLSNSVESYTPPSASSSSYESGPDSSSSYSNLSPRYLRYHGDRPTSSPYIENDDSPGSSSYDTISYSVPMGKY